MIEQTAYPILTGAFGLGVVLGVAMAWSNFCTMGAMADLALMDDRRRLAAWLLAMAVAIIGYRGVALGIANESFVEPRLDYLNPLTMFFRQALGGLLFGIGMTLSAGCVSKNLLRLGAGSAKAAVTLVVTGIVAYAWTETKAFDLVFHSWLSPLSFDTRRLNLDNQSLLAFLHLPQKFATAGALVISGALSLAVFSMCEFRHAKKSILGAVAIGLCATGGWWLTSGALAETWVESAFFTERPPRGLGSQSFSFVNPLGEMVSLVVQGGNVRYLTFGVAGAVGVAAGGFLYALFRGSLRGEWFANYHDLIRHLTGAVLMGTGAVLALGCSIGQGITGISTLSMGSIVATISMMLGAYLSLRLQLRIM